jgi:diadenosine tetraphosphate (Ap4A) HIT family hydrolase
MNDWKQDRIGSAERGENPTVIARMPSGFAVIGDTQFLPGYCVLIAVPSVEHLADLSFSQRRQFLFDMSLLGEAIENVCRPQGLRRMNYEILGNTDTYLHAHVFPRYHWEPEEFIKTPVWHYPEDRWQDDTYSFFEPIHGSMKRKIAEELHRLIELAQED